jgi:hypothetical protein
MNKQIMWNLVNSGLAAALVFLGAFTTGTVTFSSVVAALAAGLIVGVTQFKDYWNKVGNKKGGIRFI